MSALSSARFSKSRKIPLVKFLTFADRGEGYLSAASRLSTQILQLNSAFSVEIYNLERIAREDPAGYELHGEFIEKNSHGLGFWLWKPWIHNLAVKQFPDHILVYLDAGCDLLINRKTRRRFNSYILGAFKSGVFIFQLPDIEEKKFTNCETIEYVRGTHSRFELGEFNSKVELETQLSASFMIWSPGAKQREIISNWFEIAIADNYRYLTGLHPQDVNCCQELIEHRYDQSIISLLLKMNYAERTPDESHSSENISSTKLPIWGIKNFTSETQLFLRRKRINKLSRYISVVK